jgi:hypothetical protein
MLRRVSHLSATCCALTLRNMIWDDTSGQGDVVPLEFIVRHQKTLKKLELHNCTIYVGKRFWPPHCSWADIYKRLANALTRLVELKVEFKLEDEIPYVYFRGYTPHVTLAQDARALEEFRAVVRRQGMGGGSRFRL